MIDLHIGADLNVFDIARELRSTANKHFRQPKMMSMKRSALALTLALLFGTTAASAQSVWKVKTTPVGSDFTDIQDAVNAASDGDIILVDSGFYSELDIDNKALTIQAEPGADVRILRPFEYGSIIIRNLDSTQAVSLRGINAPRGTEGGFHQAGLVIRDCLGPVLVENGIYGASSVGHPAGLAHGVTITLSSSVSIVRCTIESLVCGCGPGGTPHEDPGLFAEGANVYLYDSSVTGSTGVDLKSGTFFSSNSIISGDVDAVRLSNGFGGVGAQAHLLNSVLNFGVTGQRVNVIDGLLVDLSGDAGGFSVTSPIREGETGVETYRGNPGELVLLFLSPTLMNGNLNVNVKGVDFLGQPTFRFRRGILPASGIKTKMVTINDLGPGIDAINIYEQAVFVDLITLNFTISEPSSVVILDAAF